ncbi:MAG TPA: NTP transferase domain-containing protein [Jatrophihabitans sp.]|uniref:molybdenum cofactor guanylyltransferase n=1 Tax=Jatrophihabitans sp. TaxID=1932789 RepID=UPI002EDEE408
MGEQTEQTGWTIDPAGLRAVLTDRRRVEAALPHAEPAQRLLLLGLLGQAQQGLTEGRRLLAEPAISADPWRLLLRMADLHCLQSDFAAAEQCHQQAWRHALGRERQAETLHSIGTRQFEQGDRDAAAASLQLALTLLSLFGDTPSRARTVAALARVRDGSPTDPAFDAVILAGGRGSRMGGGPAKPLRKLAGWPMLDHVLLACSAARRQIVVGPARIGIGAPLFCREQPAGSGPVAAISAGLAQVRQPVVLVLAADLPFIAGALGPLRALLAGGQALDAAALVDPSGRINHLAAAWRTAALYAALDRLGDPAGRPVRALYDSVEVAYLPDFDAYGADCDTPADLRQAESRIRQRSRGRLPAAQLAWPRLELHSPS